MEGNQESAESKAKRASEINNLGNFFENLIIFAIIIIIVITFLDEIAIIYGWSVDSRYYLLVSAFIFDLLFTAEFIVRMVVNGRHGNAGHYFFHQRGWVDFISSVPLLLLNSGLELFVIHFPEVFEAGGMGSFAGTAKVLKAIRVTRILRLLRFVKILGKIQNTNSHMANRHIAMISTTAIMSIILTYSVFSFSGYLGLDDIKEQQTRFYQRVVANIHALKKDYKKVKGENESQAIEKLFAKILFETREADSGLIQAYYKEKLILSNFTLKDLKKRFHYYPEATLNKRFHDHHVFKVTEGDFTIFLNHGIFYQDATRFQLVLFVSILIMILAFMTLYTRHFAQNVTDVVHVMEKGFAEENFNLEVTVREEFEEDEIFQLARLYNEKWLPLKMQQKDEETETGGLTLDDFLK